MRLKKLFALTCLCSLTTLAMADEEAAITPYRPSVSNPAQLSAPGQLELEMGGLSSKADDGRRNSVPYLFKLAFTPQWGLLLGGEALVSSPLEQGRAHGLGDTSVALKRAFLIDDATAFGLEMGVKLPTARDVIGSGKHDLTLNSIFSKDVGILHIDTNFNLTRIGLEQEGAARTQSGLSSSFSVPVAAQWGATAELSGTHRAGAATTAQLLTALAYSPSKRLTFDFGLAKGLNRASDDWSLFAGVVLPLAKVW